MTNGFKDFSIEALWIKQIFNQGMDLGLGNVEVGEDLKIELKGLFPQLYV